MSTEGKLPKALVYQQDKSALLVVSSNGSGTTEQARQHNCDRDAELIRDVMEKTKFTKEVSLASLNKSGLEMAIQKEVSKVPSDDDEGLFVFVYCGQSCDLWDHGLGLNSSDKDSYVLIDSDSTRARYSLDLNGFEPKNPDTHISGEILGKMIANAPSKPRQVLVVLDCPHAEEISSGIEKCLSNCELTVFVSQAKNEISRYLDTLTYSTFTYFFGTILSKTAFTPGMINLPKFFSKVKNCCGALTNLIEIQMGSCVKSVKNTPEARFFEIIGDSDSFIEADESDEVDGPNIQGGMFSKFLARYYQRSKKIRLQKKAVEWVHNAMEGPLVILKEEGALDDEKVINSIVFSMVFSLATIQHALEHGSISNTNIFIESYINVAASVSMVDQSIDILSIALLKLAQDAYLKVLRNKNVSEKEMNSMVKRMNTVDQDIFK